MKRRFPFIIFFILVFLLSSCGGGGSSKSSSKRENVSLRMRFLLETDEGGSLYETENVPEDVKSIEFLCMRVKPSGLKEYVNFIYSGSSYAGQISLLPFETFSIGMDSSLFSEINEGDDKFGFYFRAKDESGNILYAGSYVGKVKDSSITIDMKTKSINYPPKIEEATYSPKTGTLFLVVFDQNGLNDLLSFKYKVGDEGKYENFSKGKSPSLGSDRNAFFSNVSEAEKVYIEVEDMFGEKAETVASVFLAKFSDGPSMNEARYYTKALKLLDRRILFVGGTGVEWSILDTSEIYDPSDNTFSLLKMNEPRQSPVVERLSDGRVLVCGGWSVGEGGEKILSSCEIFDPKTLSFEKGPSMSEERGAAASALLKDGRVLVCGGNQFESTLSSSELYDPNTNTFKRMGDMSKSRAGHKIVCDSFGRVLILDGYSYSEESSESVLCVENFDLKSGTFSIFSESLPFPGGDEDEHLVEIRTAVSLGDGRYLIVGESDKYEKYEYEYKYGALIYDSSKGKFRDSYFQPPDGFILSRGVYDDVLKKVIFFATKYGDLENLYIITFNPSSEHFCVCEGSYSMDLVTYGFCYSGLIDLPSGKLLLFGGEEKFSSPSKHTKIIEVVQKTY